MIEISIDRADLRRWLVCESGQRWVTAVRRFSPELMPQPLVPEIIRCDPTDVIDQLSARQDRPVVVIWESAEDSLLPVCEQIIAAAEACPRALQIVSASDRTAREQAILLGLPCAAILRHPEDMLTLEPMIRSYFQL